MNVYIDKFTSEEEMRSHLIAYAEEYYKGCLEPLKTLEDTYWVFKSYAKTYTVNNSGSCIRLGRCLNWVRLVEDFEKAKRHIIEDKFGDLNEWVARQFEIEFERTMYENEPAATTWQVAHFDGFQLNYINLKTDYEDGSKVNSELKLTRGIYRDVNEGFGLSGYTKVSKEEFLAFVKQGAKETSGTISDFIEELN